MSFLAGGIVSAFFRRYDAIDARCDAIDAKRRMAPSDALADTISSSNVQIPSNTAAAQTPVPPLGPSKARSLSAASHGPPRASP